MNIKDNKSGFSVIVAILITAFLIIISSGILFLVLQETSNTRIVYNTISSYAGAEGALEYGLLKIKNHKDGFQDKIAISDDYDSKLITRDVSNVKIGKDALISYEMNNFGKSYSGTIGSGSYEIIPLFGDSGSLMQPNSKYPLGEDDHIDKTLGLNVASSAGLVWNIIGNNSNGETFGISGTGSIFNSESEGMIKTNFANPKTNAMDFSGGNVKIADFLNNYEFNYLILYNPTFNEISYSINSPEGFSFPKVFVVSSANIGDYKQNIGFIQSKSEIFDLLKYSFFNK